ncbi:Ultraviolet-B receptor uvr8 [Asimina triloba]
MMCCHAAAGHAVCSWGRGEDGQLGLGDAEDRLLPTLLTALDGHDVVSITCGADHTTAYSESEMQVFSWGWGDFGRLGHGNSSDLFTPQPIKALHGLKIKQIACGDSHCLAVTMDGQDISVKMIAAGAEHTAAVTEDGDLYGWGWGRYGNLGLGDRNDRLVPEKVSAAEISGGWRHSMAVTSDGKLYGWGWNKFGQVGVGDNVDHCAPAEVKFPNAQKVVQIACGWRHTVAVTDRQNVFSWGRGTSGQLGHGDTVDLNTPKIVEALSVDGSGGKQIEASSVDSLSGKVWVSPTERYAIVPDETGEYFLVHDLDNLFSNWIKLISLLDNLLQVNTQSGASGKTDSRDASVPENDVKRVRV